MNWKNHFGTETFEQFMVKFFNGKLHKAFKGVSFFNRRIVIPINATVNAEIKLTDYATVGEYSCLEVTIIHKANGKIAQQGFGFRDWLKLPSEHGDKNQSHACMISHCGIDWYLDGPTPDSIEYMVSKIIEYIKLYA